jgi:hypothetical protein
MSDINRIDAIYARQSVDKKDSISIESQIEFCRHEMYAEPRVSFGETARDFTEKGIMPGGTADVKRSFGKDALEAVKLYSKSAHRDFSLISEYKTDISYPRDAALALKVIAKHFESRHKEQFKNKVCSQRSNFVSRRGTGFREYSQYSRAPATRQGRKRASSMCRLFLNCS